jgi:hypothetical protein
MFAPALAISNSTLYAIAAIGIILVCLLYIFRR